MHKFNILVAASLLTLAGCSDSDNNDSSQQSSSDGMSSSSMASSSSIAAEATFKVTLHNASAAQILSPAAIVVSDEDIDLFTIGMPASNELEKLAEAGMPDDLIAKYSEFTTMTSGPTMPGTETVIELSTSLIENQRVSIATMPVYTNDAVVALQNIDVSGLEMGELMMLQAPVYDAGTEANTESLNSVPGPDIGGEAYSDIRDDMHNIVTMHPGVVGQAELSSSALGEKFRYSASSFRVTIERIN